MMQQLKRLFQEPMPLRYHALRFVDRWFDLLKYPSKLDYHTIERPWYGHPLLQAAQLAHTLGHANISAIEFGVAGGNGLLALERHAAYVTKETGVEITVFGFDTGEGMPAPADYRDLPYLWQAGYFKMDQEKLKARLKSARLVIGPVDKTLSTFFQNENPPPIGFVAFDLDYYSSTVTALKIFEEGFTRMLPRVACYVDDMVGDINRAYNEFTGELLAIKDFNSSHAEIKIAPVQGLRYSGNRIPQLWHEQIFVAHLFRHPDYGHPIPDLTQLPLE